MYNEFILRRVSWWKFHNRRQTDR